MFYRAATFAGLLPMCAGACSQSRTAVCARTKEDSSPDGYHLRDQESHVFGIEGRVLTINSVNAAVRSISISVLRAVDTAVGYVPCEAGDAVTINFGEAMANFAGLKLKATDTVRVYFAGNATKWVSNSAWIGVERGGVIYDRDGRKVRHGGDDLFHGD